MTDERPTDGEGLEAQLILFRIRPASTARSAGTVAVP
jgi:hypothetical protein